MNSTQITTQGITKNNYRTEKPSDFMTFLQNVQLQQG